MFGSKFRLETLRINTLRISTVDVGVLVACVALAAIVAVPRHIQLASDARKSEAAALARNAGSAAALAHRLWESAGHPATVTGSRGAVAIINGYPSVGTLPLMLAEPEVTAFRYERGIWQHGEARTAADCGVSYQPPTDPDAAPLIAALLTGC